MGLHWSDVLIHLFNLFVFAAGIAVLVLIFIVLIKTNKLLKFRLEKAKKENDRQQ